MNLKMLLLIFFLKQVSKRKNWMRSMKPARKSGLTSSYNLSLPVNIDFEKAIEVRGQGKFHPVKYVYGLALAFEKAGGTILQQTRVTGIEDTEGITIETENGNFRAVNLIYATHIPPGVNLLQMRCEPWRSYAMSFTIKDEEISPGSYL